MNRKRVVPVLLISACLLALAGIAWHNPDIMLAVLAVMFYASPVAIMMGLAMLADHHFGKK